MIDYILIFLTTYLFIALRALQQLNVMHERYLWVVPVSLGLGICEVFNIMTIARANNLYLAIPFFAGGVLGTWSAMRLHKRLRK